MIQPQHDLVQLLGTVVVQRDRLGPGDRGRCGIEARVDRVVGLELPVAGSRPARPVARPRVVRAADRVGQRHVATNRARHFGGRRRDRRLCGEWRRPGLGQEVTDVQDEAGEQTASHVWHSDV